MSGDEAKLSPEEVAYVKRPLTDAERAATRGMPPPMVRGWVIRARADEIVRQRGEQRTERITAALISLAEAIR